MPQWTKKLSLLSTLLCMPDRCVGTRGQPEAFEQLVEELLQKKNTEPQMSGYLKRQRQAMLTKRSSESTSEEDSTWVFLDPEQVCCSCYEGPAIKAIVIVIIFVSPSPGSLVQVRFLSGENSGTEIAKVTFVKFQYKIFKRSDVKATAGPMCCSL